MTKILLFLRNMITRLGIGKVSTISGVNEKTIKNWFAGDHKIRKDTLIKMKSRWDIWNSDNTDDVVDFTEAVDLLIKKMK